MIIPAFPSPTVTFLGSSPSLSFSPFRFQHMHSLTQRCVLSHNTSPAQHTALSFRSMQAAKKRAPLSSLSANSLKRPKASAGHAEVSRKEKLRIWNESKARTTEGSTRDANAENMEPENFTKRRSKSPAPTGKPSKLFKPSSRPYNVPPVSHSTRSTANRMCICVCPLGDCSRKDRFDAQKRNYGKGRAESQSCQQFAQKEDGLATSGACISVAAVSRAQATICVTM